jgi:glycine/D-amino acid oxidase-like deaminating enzyme
MWKDNAFVWEASDPYLYLRTTPDGRIICGGEDEDFSDEGARDDFVPRKSATLARKLAMLFPNIEPTPEFCWTGSFGTTASGLPLIGRLARRGPVYSIMGFGGNGITYSQIASEIVRSELAGEADPDAQLFRHAGVR